ncbi:conjugal transfer pilus assembly protein TraK [Hephaestia caeni]|uniref:Conjugal transfer pilus assembly protein TraK n=1 Tax=Hephaestia caeni TaxID=645617 RepID=A0A397P9Q4_9SPHN|nr:type-F conjugative transfer system secretin TraK [Hephaestia caeni]RIA46280.1 conjugal transfer pilus assembly protein TraK [Hephaestia caeni]
MAVWVICALAAGIVLAARTYCLASRCVGIVLVAMGVNFAFAGPAWADQTVMAADGSKVECSASSRDLTRISLVEDQFASVSKVSTGNPSDDFTVVNEPVRGDIYLSVPEGYSRPSLSFFATSKRGYVYKLVCRIAGEDAVQIFISNPAIANERTAVAAPTRPEPREEAAALVQAMYGQSVIDGYQMRQAVRSPVNVGTLRVQMIAEYRGAELNGRVLRIENRGREPVELDAATIAPASAVAVSVAEPRLAPGQVTTAYLVTRTGERP